MRKEILTIAVVAVFSAVISIVVSSLFITPSKNRSQKVETVESISTTFAQPSSDYFNRKSINPSQNIQIGTDPNSNPFEGR